MQFRVILFIFLGGYIHLAESKQESDKVTIKNGSQSFRWWARPPIKPIIKFYIYNVTNSDEFLNDRSKPVVDEIGPYVYVESLEKKNIQFNDNGTVSFNQEKIYRFDEALSIGREDDLVVVPNIPALCTSSQLKDSGFFTKMAMSGVMNALGTKPFVTVSAGQLIWGYDDKLLKLARDMSLTKSPFEKFGLMYNKNGTSPNTVTIFTGANDVTKSGLIDKFNGQSHLTYYTEEECNSLLASDGSIFPPQLTKYSTIRVYDKDLCRTLPLVYEKTVNETDEIRAYRFTPPPDVFAYSEENPTNLCFCPKGPPCTPSGFFSTAPCQYDSPILLSFPHFYLANDSYRTAFEGISPPNPEIHKFFINVEPITGTAMSAKARIQINLAVSHVKRITRMEKFPDIVFPIIWFEEGFDGLPKEMTNLITSS